MVAAPNRPFGALKAPSSSADMTHQKGPPATARGVSWGRCGGTDKRDEPTCPRHPTQRPAPATDRRPGKRVGSRSVGGAAGRGSELHRGSGPLAPAAVGGPVAGGGRVRAGAGCGARRDPFPARCGRGPHHARLRHRPAPARAPERPRPHPARGGRVGQAAQRRVAGAPRGGRGGSAGPRRPLCRAAGGPAGPRAGPRAAFSRGRRHRGGRRRAGRALGLGHGRECAATRAGIRRAGGPHRRGDPRGGAHSTSSRCRSRRPGCRCVARSSDRPRCPRASPMPTKRPSKTCATPSPRSRA